MFDFSLIGLSGRDKRVYEALLALGDSSIRTVADHINVNRGSVHESLQDLMRTGLVGFTAYGQRKRYVAQDPRILEQLVVEKQAELQRAQALVEPYAHYLRQQESVGAFGSFATLYEGDEGLAAILRDVISTLTREGIAEYQAISSPEVKQYLYHNFPHFTRERVRHRLFVQVIAVGHEKPASVEYAERRVMTLGGKVAPSCYTILYGNKTALISLGEANLPQGIVISNSGVTALQREQFWRLWGVCS